MITGKIQKGMLFMTKEKRNDIEKRIDLILDRWALKYNVPAEKHSYYKSLMTKPLIDLHSNIPKGDRPCWMDELDVKESDSFNYALSMAEIAYKNIYNTFKNFEIIKDHLKSLKSNEDLNKRILKSLSELSLGLGLNLSVLCNSIKGQ